MVPDRGRQMMGSRLRQLKATVSNCDNRSVHSQGEQPLQPEPVKPSLANHFHQGTARG